MVLTVFGLPVEVCVVSDGDLPGVGVQLQTLHHGLVTGDASVDNRAAITITGVHLEIRMIINMTRESNRISEQDDVFFPMKDAER